MRARGRRLLVLGVHALEGAAASGAGLGGGGARAGRRAGGDGAADAPAALRRRDEVVHHFDDAEQLPWLEKRGIELVRGNGILDGERRVRVGDDVLEAGRAVVLATGSAATLPPVEGLEDAVTWTTREATAARAVPRRLLVLGGGVAGVELADAWSRLGVRVSIVEVAYCLLAREEPFVSEQVAASNT